MKRMKKRVDDGDPVAIYTLGGHYCRGEMGLPQDYNMANELWLRAGELGYTPAYNNIGNSYYQGRGVERDLKKAKHYWELAAMRGSVTARDNLGDLEQSGGNTERAMKHWMISAGAGDDISLHSIRQCFMNGLAPKDDFERALRAHKAASDEMKCEQREAAAAYFKGLPTNDV